MIDITIYIEGVKSDNPAVVTVDNTAVFRENFHKLFSQQLSSEKFNLIIQPFGTITQSRKMLEHIEKKGINGVLLIDLDAPKEQRVARLNQYQPFDTSKIFFMIQEMEAWILSQVDKIEEFGRNEGLIRKRVNEDIQSNPLIQNIHPEAISNPDEKLDTIFRQYFDIVKIRGDKESRKGKRYSKTKDGSKLIGLLDLKILMQDFDEAKRLVDYIVREKV
jgi:hypothetical protein